MMTEKIIKGELLFHPVHGLCRVDRVSEERWSGKKSLSYALVPRVASRMKVRFVITGSDMGTSGFHKVISAKEANKLLGYLKTGDSSAEQTHHAWVLARNILSFSAEQLKPRDQKKRQLLEHSVRGLVGELACAFEITLKEAVSRIEEKLARLSKTNQLVFAALGRAAED